MKIILFVVLLLFQLSSTAQQRFTGKISDSSNSNSIQGVTVYIPDLRKVTVTDNDGKFSFENLPSSTIQIEFRAVGFKSVVRSIDLQKDSVLNVSLEYSSTELEEVLVTTNNTKLPDNTPFPANSVSQNDLRKYSSPSVMGNLAYQPGVDKITIGSGIGKPVIRGLSFNRVLLYGLGTRIENQQWDDHHDLGLSDIGIDNVEIVRGPAALIYGADALGGALIFTEEKPASSGTTVADANLGFASNTLGINTDAGIKSTDSNGFFYGLRIGGATHTSYLQGETEGESNSNIEEEEFAPNSKFMNTSIKANAGVSKKWGVSKFSYSFLNQQIGIIEDESGDTTHIEDEEEQREREMEAPYQDVTSNILSLENTLFVNKSKLNINVAYQHNERKEFEPLADKQKELAIGLNLNTITYDLKWTGNIEKDFGYVIGTQGLFLKNENNGLESLVPDAEVSDIAGYGLIRYDHKKINLLAGFRYDTREIEAESYEKGEEENELFIIHQQSDFVSGTIDTINKPEAEFNKSYNPFSFSAGACFLPNEHLTFKLNAVTGFSAPNYAQLGTFGKHEGTYRFERGNENLNVEQNLEGDFGVIWENPFITLNASAYINKIKDYIYIINTGDSMEVQKDGVSEMLPLYDYRQNDATLSGFESGFDIHPRNLKWLDLKCSYAMVSGQLENDQDLPYIPSAKLVTEVKFTREKIGKLNNSYLTFVFSNYSKQTHVTEYELATPGYSLVDLHIGTTFKLGKQVAMAEVYCTNLLNTGYYNQLSLVKYIGVKDMGRNIGMQLHIPIFTGTRDSL